MKSKKINHNFIKNIAISFLFASTAVTVQAEQQVDKCIAGAKPLLSVADFNADGIVNNLDLILIAGVIKNDQYIAYFDRNADGHVDAVDFNITNQEMGRNSTQLDREIAEVYWATTPYRHLGQAALDGYVPFTPVVVGHGQHWLQPITFIQSAFPNEPQRSNPEGLNYDASGNLLAVYWGSPTQTDADGFITSAPPGSLFTEDAANPQAMWHAHERTCTINLGFIDYAIVISDIDPAVCREKQGLSDGAPSSFYMMHLWLYYLNPEGAFNMTHPCAGEGGIQPPHPHS